MSDDNYKCSQSVCRDSLVKTVRAERDDLLRDRYSYSKWLEENRYTINARNDEIVALKTEIKQLKFWKCQGDNVLAQANKRIVRYREALVHIGYDGLPLDAIEQIAQDAVPLGDALKPLLREEFIVEQEKIMDAYESEFQAITGIKPVPIEEQCLRAELIAFKGALDSVTDERDSLRDEITRYDGAVCALRDEYTRAVNGRETFPTILASVVKGILDAIGDKDDD